MSFISLWAVCAVCMCIMLHVTFPPYEREHLDEKVAKSASISSLLTMASTLSRPTMDRYPNRLKMQMDTGRRFARMEQPRGQAWKAFLGFESGTNYRRRAGDSIDESMEVVWPDLQPKQVHLKGEQEGPKVPLIFDFGQVFSLLVSILRVENEVVT